MSPGPHQRWRRDGSVPLEPCIELANSSHFLRKEWFGLLQPPFEVNGTYITACVAVVRVDRILRAFRRLLNSESGVVLEPCFFTERDALRVDVRCGDSVVRSSRVFQLRFLLMRRNTCGFS